MPAGITLRDHYTAQEDQTPDFAVPYTDFGARQYNTALRRWMTPDPLSEKYYGISPYAFCNNSPMVFVDPDGEVIGFVFDMTSVGFGVHSLVQNIKAGNVWAAVGDGAGILVDVVAAAIPVVPGGVGYIRHGAKAADAFDDAVDLSKITHNIGKAENVTTSTADLSKLSPMERGRYNEARVLSDLNLTKNTKTIKGNTKTGEIRNTIPDAITTDTIYEIKDVKSLSYTKQIQAQIDFAKKNGFNYKIIIGKDTYVSTTIPQEYIIRLDYIGPQ